MKVDNINLKHSEFTLKSAETASRSDIIITVESNTTGQEYKCIGHSTVWYSYPECERLSTSLEGYFSSFHKYIKVHRLLDEHKGEVG